MLLLIFAFLTSGTLFSQQETLSDSALLDLVQKETIKYFTEGAEPVSG